jgi:hypothetical protein
MRQQKFWGWVTALFVAVSAGLGITAYTTYVPHPALISNEESRLTTCRMAIQAQLGQTSVDLKTLAGIHGLCYVEVNEADTLQAFTQQLSALYNQQNQLPLLLWMVVILTVSGIGLAGVQLYGAYRLAFTGKGDLKDIGGRIEISRERISLDSPVAGIVILIISFAFFFVFVKYVYLIQDVKITPNSSVTGPAPVLYGWAPTLMNSASMPVPVGALREVGATPSASAH